MVATDKPLDGQVVLITGAGRGVAKVLAAKMAGAGAKIAAFDLVADRVEATARALREQGADAAAFTVDVGGEAQVAAAVEAIIARWGRIDTLVNAAGSYGAAHRPTHETPVDEWDQVFASNVRGTFLCAKAVLPHMMQRRSGRIINFASNAGRSVSPLLGCSYTAAKTAVIGITRHLSREYARHGILVNTIAPGPVGGERLVDLLDGHETPPELLGQIPLGRLAEPEEIADVALFLASPGSRFMTGAIVDVSGGLILA
jgi:NAD(P)-dependent dehydrogenase (short-subunit alcohol dehydrogenase family)